MRLSLLCGLIAVLVSCGREVTIIQMLPEDEPDVPAVGETWHLSLSGGMAAMTPLPDKWDMVLTQTDTSAWVIYLPSEVAAVLDNPLITSDGLFMHKYGDRHYQSMYTFSFYDEDNQEEKQVYYMSIDILDEHIRVVVRYPEGESGADEMSYRVT